MIHACFLILLSLNALAAPPIEGGKDAPLSSFDYIDVIKIKGADQSECSATRVSPTLILTAAHCVSTTNVGMNILSLGKVMKVTIHPKYEAAKAAKLKTQKTLYDIAFIEVEQRASKRTMPYPQIISAKTKLGSRKKMEMAGYGSNETYWDGNKFEYKTTKSNLQLAENGWEACPLDYFGNQINALDKFNRDLTEHMSVKAKRVHTIINGQESLAYDGLGMLLPGDSGSPSLERDEKNKFVVTGVASNIVAFQDGSGEAEFEIEVEGKVLATKKLKDMPENWGYRNKRDVEFSDIKSILNENKLLSEIGDLKPGVIIRRKYTRVSQGNYADLSHPENQKFIQLMMSP